MLFFYRVTVKEEEMMIERFGEVYRVYRDNAGRFWPRLSAEVLRPDRS